MDGAILLSLPNRTSISTIFSYSSSTCNNTNSKIIIRFPIIINKLSHSTHHRSSFSSSVATPVVAFSSSSSTFDDDVTISDTQDIGLGGDATTRARKTTTISKAGSNFSRLKSDKIRSLALKTANKMMKDGNRQDYDDDITMEEDGTKHEHRERQRFNISRSNSTNVSGRESKTRPNRDRSEVMMNREDVGSVSRVSSSSTKLRGWNGEGRGGGGERSNRWVRSEYTNRNMKQQSWKVPPAVDYSFFSQKSFREVGCNDSMIEFLKSQHMRRPSHIQALAFTPVLELKSCIIADQSGSGKTLAYLLPVIQRIRQEELEGRSNSMPQSPRVVILVPTSELACQVLSNSRKISKYGVPFRSIVATGGFSQKTQLESLEEKLDVIIATPGRFMFLIKQGLLHLSNLTCAILDEVDILFNDEDYGPALQILIKSSPVTTQYLFVTATLPTDIYNKLIEVFPDCEMIMGPGMHRTSPGLEEILVDCSGDEGTSKTPDTAFDNKRSALLKFVKEIRVAKTIIFCNKIETCRKVENVLKRVDRKSVHAKVLPFHSALAKESQLANMEEFCSTHQLDTHLFLVCTDRASRGIDFDGVDHVVLFDYPRDPSEYVRRVGRTARGAGGKGKAYIFVVGKQVSLARRVIDRNIKGHPLHDLPTSANYNFDWGV